MDVAHLRRNLGNWSRVGSMPVFAPVEWADEGHFQRKCLQLRVPIVLNDLLHYPICAEFPFNPGIDLIFLAPEGYLVLTEVKRSGYNANALIHQAIGQYHRARNASVSELRTYLRTKPVGHDVAEGAGKLLDIWLDRGSVPQSTTLKQLFLQNKLALAVMTPGMPTQSLIAAAISPVAVYGMKIGTSMEVADVYFDTQAVGPSIDSATAQRVEKLGQEYVSTTPGGATCPSNKPSPAEVHAYFTEGAPEACRYLYKQLRARGFNMKPGSTVDYSVMVQPLDATGAHRTLLRIFGRGTIELPGNLYQQQHQWDVDEPTIDQLFQQIARLFPERLLNRQAGKNLEIRLNNDGDRVTQPVLDKIIVFIADFLNK